MKKTLKITYTVADGVVFTDHFQGTKKQARKFILNRYRKFLIENMKIEEI